MDLLEENKRWCSKLIQLLQEYEKTLIHTNKQLNEKKRIKAKYDSFKGKLSPSGMEYLEILNHDIKILNAAARDIAYTIEWIAIGGNPARHRGVERRTVYEKEILMNPLANSKFQMSDRYNLNDTNDSSLEAIYKSDLADDLTKSFTARQKEIFELHAQKYTEVEIAQLLGTSQQYISKTIIRCREKVKEEGWIMI